MSGFASARKSGRSPFSHTVGDGISEADERRRLVYYWLSKQLVALVVVDVVVLASWFC